MRVLGIDPGTLTMGYGILDASSGQIHVAGYGALKAPPHKAISERLGFLLESLQAIIEQYHPDTMVIEKAFFGINARSAIALGEGRGVALAAAHLAGMNVYEYSASQIKRSVTGNGRAHKSQIQKMTQNIFQLPELPQPEDAADALAAAYCFLNAYKTHSKMAVS